MALIILVVLSICISSRNTTILELTTQVNKMENQAVEYGYGSYKPNTDNPKINHFEWKVPAK